MSRTHKNHYAPGQSLHIAALIWRFITRDDAKRRRWYSARLIA